MTRRVVWSDPGAGLYRKLVIVEDRLAGAVFVGDVAEQAWCKALIRSGESVAGLRDDLIVRARRGRAAPAGRLTGRETMLDDFDAEQKRYLEGFASGIQAARVTGSVLAAPAAGTAPSEPTGPDAIHVKAQDRTVAAGGKLSDAEKWKRAENPFDGHARLAAARRKRGRPPKPGRQLPLALPRPVLGRAGAELLHVPPADPERASSTTGSSGASPTSPNAMAADTPHVTTRANLQVREITPEGGAALPRRALRPRPDRPGAPGADNIRKRHPGSSTAGIDPQELLDTRPARASLAPHHGPQRPLALWPAAQVQTLRSTAGGVLPTLEETNDIGFQAVEVLQGAAIEPGTWSEGGCSAASPATATASPATPAWSAGPRECTAIADAMIRGLHRERATVPTATRRG